MASASRAPPSSSLTSQERPWGASWLPHRSPRVCLHQRCSRRPLRAFGRLVLSSVSTLPWLSPDQGTLGSLRGQPCPLPPVTTFLCVCVGGVAGHGAGSARGGRREPWGPRAPEGVGGLACLQGRGRSLLLSACSVSTDVAQASGQRERQFLENGVSCPQWWRHSGGGRGPSSHVVGNP